MTDRADPSAPGSPRTGWTCGNRPTPRPAPARSSDRLRTALGDRPLEIHDLGSGTGSMPRWLAPQLPGPQRWVLHDHDPALLAVAARRCAGLRDAHGQPVAIETRTTELGRLRPADLAGADLVTASALLDLLTAAELDGLAAACADAGRPALLTLSVAGHVELDPPDPRDREFAAAFDAHQRRTVAGRRLLGPDAPEVAAATFARHGLHVRSADSPWRLGPDRAELTAHWLRGWVAAAAEQRPDLRGTAAGYLADRLRAGIGLTALVLHRDLLVLPDGDRATSRGTDRPAEPLSEPVARHPRPAEPASPAEGDRHDRHDRPDRTTGPAAGGPGCGCSRCWPSWPRWSRCSARRPSRPACTCSPPGRWWPRSAIGLATTALNALRWRLVAQRVGLTLPLGNAIAETYRAIFLNAVLPGGVLGDVDRAVRHGRSSGDVGRGARAVAIERTAGQLVLVLAALVVIPAEPARGPGDRPPGQPGPADRARAGRAASRCWSAGCWLRRRSRPATSAGPARLRRVLGDTAADVRAGALARGAWPLLLGLSAAALAGYLLLFLIAARVAGATAPVIALLPPLLLALIAMGLPISIGGWGPREGVAAFTFWMAGLGAPLGVTTSVAYGALALIASLPGGVLLLARRFARTHPPVQPVADPSLVPVLPTQRSRHRLAVPGLAAEHSEAS